MSIKIPESLPWEKIDANVRDANGDLLFSNGRGGNIHEYIKQGDEAIAYAVHAANNYPALKAQNEALVKALEALVEHFDSRYDGPEHPYVHMGREIDDARSILKAAKGAAA